MRDSSGLGGFDAADVDAGEDEAKENFKRMRAEQAATKVQTTGKELRAMMDWMDADFYE